LTLSVSFDAVFKTLQAALLTAGEGS